MNSEKTIRKADKPKQSAISEVFDYLEIFVFAACAVLLLFTLSIRLCRVDGDSMYDTLKDKQLLFVNDIFYTPKDGDIVVFHQSDNQRDYLNKPLVKRVIATEGQYYRIEYIKNTKDASKPTSYYTSMKVYVSNDDVFDESELMDDGYIDYSALTNNRVPFVGNNCTVDENGVYVSEGKVPEGKIFVMGDNRYNSNDSRLEVGYVDVRFVLGKVLFRLTPPGSVY